MADKPSPTPQDPEHRHDPQFRPGGTYPQRGYYPQDYYQQPPPPKKRRIWPWVLIGIFVLFFGGCIVMIATISSSDEATVAPGNGGDEPADNGLVFPGKQPGDTAANAGDAVTVDNVTTTTTPLFGTSSFGSSYLCTTVTIRNDSDSQADFNVWDWKLQDPNGAIRNSSFTGTENQLQSGEVAPGGAVTGDVCFDSPQGSPSGQYIVLNDPSFTFSTDRIGWVNQR
jgi:hypothetical protein